MKAMGHIFTFKEAVNYEKWFKDPANQTVSDIENRLMMKMLKPSPRDSIIDIGCGTGRDLVSFLDSGLNVTGLDPSPYMLDIAAKKVEERAELSRGFAEDLPFEDNSFNYASIVTTLEFSEKPAKAIEEAARVAKDKLFLGVLNTYAIEGVKRRIRGLFSETIYNKARFFGVWELKSMIKSILGDVPIDWRTVYQTSSVSGIIGEKIEKTELLQRCPFGAFIGMVVILKPRFRTKPLTLRYPAKQTTEMAPG